MKSEAFRKAFNGFFEPASVLATSLDGTKGVCKRGPNLREWYIFAYCFKQAKSDEFSDVKAVAGELKAMTSSKLKSLITAFKNR